MKHVVFAAILTVLISSLMSGCGKEPKADMTVDKFIDVSELYSSLVPTIADIGEGAVAASFSEWGHDITSFGASLEESDRLSDEELDVIYSSLDNIEKELASLSGASGVA